MRQCSQQKYQVLPSFWHEIAVFGSTDIPQIGSISKSADVLSETTVNVGSEKDGRLSFTMIRLFGRRIVDQITEELIRMNFVRNRAQVSTGDQFTDNTGIKSFYGLMD